MVGESRWLYRTNFPTPKLSGEKAVLAFDGLDTHATVRLNNEVILENEDMFIPERVDVTSLLLNNDRKLNILEITFESTYLIGKKLVEGNPDHYWGCWNGDPSRLAVRKAQYHYVMSLGQFSKRWQLIFNCRAGIGVLHYLHAALGDRFL